MHPDAETTEGLLKPITNQAKVETYLNETYEDPRERIQAGKLLAGIAEFNSFADVAHKARDLHDLILMELGSRALSQGQVDTPPTVADIERAGKDAASNLLFVTNGEKTYDWGFAGSSDAFITYLYKEMNGIAGEQVVPFERLSGMQSRGELKGKTLVNLDDTSYSGLQARETLTEFLNRIRPETHIIMANFGNYRDAVEKALTAGDGDNSERVSVVSLAGHQQQGPNNIGSFQIWPHMISDTSRKVIAAFASSVLAIRNPNGY